RRLSIAVQSAASSPMSDGISQSHSKVSASDKSSHRYVEVAERHVEARLPVRAFLALTDDEGARNEKFSSGKFARPDAGDHDALRRDSPASLDWFFTGDVDDCRGGRQNYARSDDRFTLDEHALDDHASRAQKAAV